MKAMVFIPNQSLTRFCATLIESLVDCEQRVILCLDEFEGNFKHPAECGKSN